MISPHLLPFLLLFLFKCKNIYLDYTTRDIIMESSNWRSYLLFKNAVVFETRLDYVFELEEEFFDVRSLEGRKARIVVERVPKRNWSQIKEMFPYSIVYIMLELGPLDIYKLTENNHDKNNIIIDLKRDAFEVLRAFIISYRRLVGNWINLHLLDPPISPEEFSKKIQKYYFVLDNGRLIEERRGLFLDYPMTISVGKSIPYNQKVALESYMQFLLYPLPEEARLFEIFNIFDASIANYVKRNYPISLILAVTSMEAMLQWFIFKTSAKSLTMKIRNIPNESKLKEKYQNASGLIARSGKGKVPQFLIPIAKEIDGGILKELEGLMSDLRHVYDTRSRFVHEGILVTEKDSKLALKVASEFIRIILRLVRKIEKEKELYWIFKYHV